MARDTTNYDSDMAAYALESDPTLDPLPVPRAAHCEFPSEKRSFVSREASDCLHQGFPRRFTHRNGRFQISSGTTGRSEADIFNVARNIEQTVRRYRGGQLRGLHKLHGSPAMRINSHSVRYRNSGPYNYFPYLPTLAVTAKKKKQYIQFEYRGCDVFNAVEGIALAIREKVGARAAS